MPEIQADIQETRDANPNRFGHLGARIAMGAGIAGTVLASGASAAVNWTEITDMLDGVATSLMPSLVSLVTAAVPVLIVLAIVGFVMGFFDKILDMMKGKL